MKRIKKEIDWMFYILVVSGIILIFVMQSMCSFLQHSYFVINKDGTKGLEYHQNFDIYKNRQPYPLPTRTLNEKN